MTIVLSWKNNALLIFFLSVCMYTQAQTDTTRKTTALTYPAYLSAVGSRNLAYAAERFNIDLAEARMEAASVFPDPVITFSGNNNGQNRMKMGYGFTTSASWLMELGDKRKARQKVASSQRDLAGFLLSDYFRNLRANATVAYLQVIMQKQLLKVSMESYASLASLAAYDSIRFQLGQIPEINVRQSRIEAGMMMNKVLQNQASLQASLISLSVFMGNQPDTTYMPVGTTDGFDRSFDLQQLVTAATENRSDVLAAQKNNEVSRNRLELARANRVIDLGLNAAVANNAVVRNQVAPAPSTSVVSAGISIPLKFSNKYKGELLQAQYTLLQSEVQYQQGKMIVQSEVTTAYYNYLSAKKQVLRFQSGLLEDAQKTLDGKIYSYQRGETKLLEVLTAQRTYNDVLENYNQTLYAYGISLVELERAAGIWDINL